MGLGYGDQRHVLGLAAGDLGATGDALTNGGERRQCGQSGLWIGHGAVLYARHAQLSSSVVLSPGPSC
jgi:hypothetical protein